MAFLNEIKKHPLKTVKTCLIGFIFVGLGMFIAAPGPSMLDLQALANTTIEKTALILPARSFGYAIGSVIAGIVGDRMDQQIVLSASLVTSVISIFLFPIFPSINVMYAFMIIAGVANGTLDTISNVWIIHIWGKENPPFMQIVHFMYGVGAFIAPFLIEPFLKNKEDFDTLTINSNSSDPTNLIKSDEIIIQYPYYIIAVYYLFTTISFITVYMIFPSNPVHPSRSSVGNEDYNGKKDSFRLNKPLEKNVSIFVVIVSTIVMHAYVGLEISFGSLLSPFAVKSNLKMSKSEGSFLTSAYWFTYTFLRIFSLIGIIYLSPRLLLLINFGIIMFSNAILLPFANNYRWALWTGSALMGLGCSSVFATMFAFLEQLLPVTSRITSFFFIAACAGEFVIPTLVAAYLENAPQVFLWVVFVYSWCSFIGVLLLIGFQFYVLRKQKTGKIIDNKMVELETDSNDHRIMDLKTNGIDNKAMDLKANGIDKY